MFLLPAKLFAVLIASVPFAVLDAKKRAIDVRLFLLLFLSSLLYAVLMKRPLREALTGVFPGVVLFALSFLTGGQVGKGDAVFFLCISGFLTAREGFLLLGLCWMLAFFGALWTFLFSGKRSIPFLSFVPGAVLLWIFCEVCG